MHARPWPMQHLSCNTFGHTHCTLNQLSPSLSLSLQFFLKHLALVSRLLLCSCMVWFIFHMCSILLYLKSQLENCYKAVQYVLHSYVFFLYGQYTDIFCSILVCFYLQYTDVFIYVCSLLMYIFVSAVYWHVFVFVVYWCIPNNIIKDTVQCMLDIIIYLY